MAIKYAKVVNNIVQEVVMGDENFLTSNIIPNASEYVAVDGDVAVDWIYDPESATYKPPKLFDSWVWDDSLNIWVAPTPMPNDAANSYEWNENTTSWEVID